MPQSFCNLTYHLVFSTKQRRPWITKEFGRRLYDYLGGTIRDLGGTMLAINGMPDHVHILTRLRQDIAVSVVLRKIKASSRKWIHGVFPDATQFAWQSGYGAFTVSKSRIEDVRAYLDEQEQHHRTRTFQEEFVALLEAHGIEYDEKFLWDEE